MKTLNTVLAIGLMMLIGTEAAAQQQSWLVTPITTRGVDSVVGETFKALLENEISARNNAIFMPATGEPCSNSPCAMKQGKESGAVVSIYGALSALGSKIVVTVTVVEVPSGKIASNQRMVVDRIEDLEAVTTRVATAILGGTTTDETAELGNITHKETKPSVRREGSRALSLRLGGITPLGSSYAEAGTGILFYMSYWFETDEFAIEPRLGFRFDSTKEGNERSYFEMPVDLGVYYMLGRGDFTPFIGGGGGLRYIDESRINETTLGTVIPETSTEVLSDSGWGFGTFARAGIMLFRTYSMRLAISAEYNITFMELNGNDNPQSLTFGINVMF